MWSLSVEATRGEGMDQDVWNREDGHLAQGARMAVAAVASAVLTATLVIAVGQSLIAGSEAPQRDPEVAVIRASH